VDNNHAEWDDTAGVQIFAALPKLGGQEGGLSLYFPSLVTYVSGEFAGNFV
jgi:hypothetical protein